MCCKQVICTLAFSSLLLAVGVQASDRPAYRTVGWYELEDRVLSSLGSRVFEGARGEWVHAESDHFVCHARSLLALDEVLPKAEYSFGKVSEILGLPALDGKGHIFVIESEEEWDKLLQKAGAVEDGAAVHVEHDIFVHRSTTASTIRIVDVPHEMVHYRVRNAHRFKLPLWLEEGLALECGWRIGKSYREAAGYELTRSQEPLNKDELLPLKKMLKMKRYPNTPGEMRAFYRESSELVRLVWSLLDDEQFSMWLHAVGAGRADWDEVLKDKFKFSNEDLSDMLRRVEDNVTKEESGS